MVGPTVSGEVAQSVSATVRQDRWLSKTEPGLQTRLQSCSPPQGGPQLFLGLKKTGFYDMMWKSASTQKGATVMGVFSKHHRYREAGEAANVYNVERFGHPFKSLFTSTKVFTLHHHIDITDSRERLVYQSNTKLFSIHDKTDVTDAAGRQVAHIERKLLTLHARHRITLADGTYFELSRELFHIYKDIMNLEGLGWQLRGNAFALNFELYDEMGGIIAVIGQKMLSLHDKYCMDIYQPQYEHAVVAILVTLQHMIRDRESHSGSGGSSSSSG